MSISPLIARREDFETDSEFKVYSLMTKLYGSSETSWVFANVNYVDAGRKLNGQVDFIYLDERIILFIEVKGGTLNFDKHTGRLTKNYGESEKDPFKQVTDYLYDFRDKKINSRFSTEYFNQKLAFGYCVLLPEAEKPAAFKDAFTKGEGIWTIEYSPALVGDINDLLSNHAFSESIDRFKSYWLDHSHNKNHNGLSDDEVERLALFIRDDLKFEIPLPKYLQINDIQTKFYTKEQGETILRLIDRNKMFGFIINGGPGTGKTLIARELLIKRRSIGESVLFVCRNKSLADFFRKDIFDEDPFYLQKSELIHTQGLYEEIIVKNELTSLVKSANANDQELASVILENKVKLKQLPSFDYLIIDEGQDLFMKNSFEVLAMCLKGGFDSTHFSIFMDKDSQNSYGEFDTTFFRDFCEKLKPLDFELTRNCRNTRGIIEMSGQYTGTIECECMKESAQQEKARYWSNEDELLSLIKTKTNELLNKKVSKSQITILAYKEVIQKVVDSDHYRYASWNETDEFSFLSDRIMVMTPEAFKGLENNIVIFTGTPTFDYDDPKDIALWHVAFTRAKDSLVLFLPANLKDTLNKIYLQNTRKKLTNYA